MNYEQVRYCQMILGQIANVQQSNDGDVHLAKQKNSYLIMMLATIMKGMV